MYEDASVSEHLLEWLVNVLPTGLAETAGDAACGELMPLIACREHEAAGEVRSAISNPRLWTKSTSPTGYLPLIAFPQGRYYQRMTRQTPHNGAPSKSVAARRGRTLSMNASCLMLLSTASGAHIICAQDVHRRRALRCVLEVTEAQAPQYLFVQMSSDVIRP